ncbi:MAG TPA: serine/threonine-protein kinase, partial [Pirellulales bacterium]
MPGIFDPRDAVDGLSEVELSQPADHEESLDDDFGSPDLGLPAMPVQTTDELLRALSESRLLSAEQFAAVSALAHESPRGLVDTLVARGWVTGWQAEALIKGRKKFHLGGFRLLRELGQGTMGKVYMAREQAAQRIVALKVLSDELIDDRQSLERFRREARAAGSLQHPNIVAALGAGQVEKTHFLVMEYVAGKSLAEWIAHYERLPIAWSCECVRQAALGLQHAYERNVVHRDVKPANLMVLGEGVDRT